MDKPRTKQQIMRDLCLFMYNPQTNKIMGRTPTRWGKLGLCYLVVYTFLCTLSAGMFSVFYYELISKDVPKLTGIHSVLDGFPGVSRQPNLDDPIYSSSNASFLAKVKPYVNKLQDYLNKHYKNPGGQEAIQCNDSTVLKKGQLCKLNISEFFPLNSPCTGANGYGYLSGRPCVLVKLNKMFDWIPEIYKKSELPDGFPTNRFYEKRLAMSCYGAYPPDQENIGSINYIPKEGIHIKYYPYDGQQNYLTPFIWAQFMNITRHMVVNIRCKFFAKNIGIHRRLDISYVRFQILVD